MEIKTEKMKKIIKNNEGVITASIGLIWIVYGYVSNDYEFDGYPNGSIFLLIGLIIMFGKYIWGKDNIKKNKETKP